MFSDTSSVHFEAHYQNRIKANKNFLYVGAALFITIGMVGMLNDAWVLPFIGLFVFLLFFWLERNYNRPYQKKLQVLKQPFPTTWKTFLEEHSFYYQALSEPEKEIFNKRVQLFLEEKRMVGVETEVEDETKLLVAASAIIPTFAFPYFEYPNVQEIVLYPNGFDEEFRTKNAGSQEEGRFLGMVGNRFLNNTVLLSKPDLLAGFKGKADKQNVGIHEFVHLLDKADGATDGLPEIFLANQYTLPWLKALKEETNRIKRGKSDINPYGLKNNAEFLAVVSEYFFDNPSKFHERHPELYQLLCHIYHQKTDS